MKRKCAQLTVSTLAKQPKNCHKLPVDPVSFIAKHTHSPPDMSELTKLTLINECNVLYLKPIPKSWLYNNNKMKEFMKENIDKTVGYTFYILRDAKLNATGECLIKFSNPNYCHKAWFDLRGVTIDNKPVSVDVDMGHTIIKQVCKKDRLERKHLIYTHHPEGSTDIVYKFTNRETQGYINNSNVANSNNTNTDTENESNLASDSVLLARIRNKPFYKTNYNIKKIRVDTLYNTLLPSLYVNTEKSDGSQNTALNENNEKKDGSQNTALNENNEKKDGSQNTTNAINHCVGVKPPFMPLEEFDESSYYGLNEEFLRFLGLKLPLRTLIIVTGLDKDLTDDKLKEVFSLAGTVRRASIRRKEIKIDSLTCSGLIEYDHPLEAVQAVSMFHNKKLNGHSLSVTMTKKSFGLALPEGLAEVGPGLGLVGEPLRGARVHTVLQSSSKMLDDFKTEFENKMRKFEKTAAAHNAKMDFLIKKVERMISKVPEVPTPLPQQIEAASQLVNALSSLVHPNIMMPLMNLLSAQGLVQQGMWANQANSINAMQSQMMLQNAAYAQNVDIQGMTPQPFLPNENPHLAWAQSGLAQTQLTHTMEPQMISAPQTYYGQPGVEPMQTVPVEPVLQANSLQSQTSSPDQIQPALIHPSTQDQNQQILDFSLKVVQDESSKNHAQDLNDQGKIPQPTLPCDTPPYCGQPQIVQPGFVPIQTVPSPAPVEPVLQANSPQLQTSSPDQIQPASRSSQDQNQQILDFTPKVVQDESSKNHAQDLNDQGMIPQPTLPCDQPQIVQPGFVPIQTVPSPASVSQINPPQPPQTPYPDQTQRPNKKKRKRRN